MRDARHLVVVVACIAIGATAASGGGYLPTTWGWATLGPAAIAAAALFLQQDLRTTRAGAAFGILLVLAVAWTGASLLWTDSVPRTVNEIERDLVYVATVYAILVLPRNRLALTAGILAATVGVCVAGLVTRLFPGQYGLDADSAHRLARPVGYWNAMGALAAIGTLLALGLASDARSRVLRACASASPVVLLPTLLFSASRGAAIALAAGIAVALALHRERGRSAVVTVVTGVPAAAAVLFSARSHELTGVPSSLGAATHEGHTLAMLLLALAVVALLAPLVVDVTTPMLPRLPRLAPRTASALAAIAIGAGVVAAVVFGGKAYDAFSAPTKFGQTSLGAHLFSLSGHDRSTYWHVALNDYRDHPLLGSGAGTYDLYWTRDRPFGAGALDAHSLYVETLAELGPLGLALLVAALGAPFLALRGARDCPLVPALAAAFSAYLVHAAADWDWELPTLTLVALICGATLAGSDERRVRVRARPLVTAFVVAVAVAAVAIQRGNDATAEANTALRGGHEAEALRSAHRASRWAPWAAEPWRVRAEAERALGHVDLAQRNARKAATKDPRDWIGWFGVANLTTGAEHESAVARVRGLNPFAPQTVPGAAVSAIFYYPWYGTPRQDGAFEKWQQNGHAPPSDIASAYYPARGVYSSSDPAVLDAQMREIARAGIGEIVVSWWGRGSAEDERLPELIRAARARTLIVAAHLEPYSGRTVAGTGRDIAYLRSLGITDFFVYHATDFVAGDWLPVTSTLPGVRLFAQTPIVDYAKAGGFQGVYTYDTLTYRGRMFASLCSQAHSQGLLCAPSVGPGYNAVRATGDPRLLDRRAGKTYDEMWRAALRAHADITAITSYNEWLEGTQIEPARAQDSYASYGGAWGAHGTAAQSAYLRRTKFWTSRLQRQHVR
jgi:hypothetical protein